MQTLSNYVDGAWKDSDDIGQNINPSDTADVICEFHKATPEIAKEAIASASDAAAAWGRTSPQERADILTRMSNEISTRSEELGTLLSREEGKTLKEGIGEVTRSAQLFQFFAGEALRMTGERLPSTRPGVTVDITREPVGVIGVITPWNFPSAIPAWKIAPALAFGNTVVFKCAELVPASAHALVDIAARAGVPPGVLNLLIGSGSLLGPLIYESDQIDALTFTGSQPVGAEVLLGATQRMTPVQLEMGGKNPLVVAADADLELAVDVATNGAFFSTGQRCTASSRLIVDRAVVDEFVDKLISRVESLVVGNALGAETEIGPVVDERQLRTDLEYLQVAREDGVEAIVGGELLDLASPGFYLSPAIVLGTENSQRINREEVFGPIASVIEASDYEEALAIANDTPFGLSSGICTTSLRLAEHFQANSQAGIVTVNLPTAGVDPHVPFGGTKASSYGPREQGSYAREFFTKTKTGYRLP